MASGDDDDEGDVVAKPRDRRTSSLGLASRHALDASRVDERGRKALHRFVGGVSGVAPEHLKRVIESHPEAAAEADHDGWLPLHHYCRGLGGELEEEEDDVEAHLGSIEQRAAPWHDPVGRRSDAPRRNDPVFFAEATCLADVRREYKAMLLKYHPDKNIGNEDEACRQMQRLQDAYADACRKFREPHPLEAACLSGDISQLVSAIAKCTSDEVKEFVDGDGNTLLHLACARCARHVAPEQLEAVVKACGVAALGEQNKEGDTPLHVLCACHRAPAEFEGLLEVLLRDGGAESATRQNSEGRLPLHVACRNQRFLGQARNDTDALGRLLRASPEAAQAKDAYDWTALHLFAQFQIDPTVASLRTLVDANPLAASARTCVDEDAPIHLACYAQRRKISPKAVEILRVFSAASPRAAIAACRANRRPWDHLPRADDLFAPCCAAILETPLMTLDTKHLRSFRDARDGTLLHVLAGLEGAALPEPYCDRVVAAIGGDGGLERRDADGATPLHRFCSNPQRHLDSCALPFLAKLISPASLSSFDAAGWTPLHRACAACDDDAAGPVIARILEIEDVAGVATQDETRSFPVHLVCGSCSRAIGVAVPPVLARLAAAAPRAAYRRDARGKHAWDYLPRHDDLFDDCLKILLGELVNKLDDDDHDPEDNNSSSSPKKKKKKKKKKDEKKKKEKKKEEEEEDQQQKEREPEAPPPPPPPDEEVDDDEDEEEEGTVLHLVCAHHRAYVERALEARPAEAFATDAGGNTPLHAFAQHQKLSIADDQDLDVLTALLRANEDAVLVENRAGLTPVHLLCAHQKPAPCPQVLTALLAARPEVARARCARGDTPVSLLCRANAEGIAADTPRNLRALLDAANFSCSSPKTSKIIKRRRRNSEEEDNEDDGVVVVDLDVMARCSRGLRPWDHLPRDDPRYAECCAVLLRDFMAAELFKVDDEREALAVDKQGNTALHLLCCRAGELLRERWVPSARSSIFEARNEIGATPLHCACQYFFENAIPGDGPFFERLVALTPARALVLGNKSGWTPLHHFVQRHATALCADDGDASWHPFRALLAKNPRAVGLKTSSGDTPLHFAANANRKAIGPATARLLEALVSAAPDVATLATRARGKGKRTPVEWLPAGDPRFAECDEILTHRAARCLELLLESHARAAEHALPETGELALHQLCAVSPPVLTLRMLAALLAANAPAAAAPRTLDAANPLHLLCRALAQLDASSAKLETAPDLIRALLDAAPRAAAMLDADGKRPSDYLAPRADLFDDCLAVFALVDPSSPAAATTVAWWSSSSSSSSPNWPPPANPPAAATSEKRTLPRVETPDDDGDVSTTENLVHPPESRRADLEELTTAEDEDHRMATTPSLRDDDDDDDDRALVAKNATPDMPTTHTKRFLEETPHTKSTIDTSSDPATPETTFAEDELALVKTKTPEPERRPRDDALTPGKWQPLTPDDESPRRITEIFFGNKHIDLSDSPRTPDDEIVFASPPAPTETSNPARLDYEAAASPHAYYAAPPSPPPDISPLRVVGSPDDVRDADSPLVRDASFADLGAPGEASSSAILNGTQRDITTTNVVVRVFWALLQIFLRRRQELH
ncbi:hypothetical protein CTAYLR_001996 [Chrysophaeum taylorii]|uniref:Uncharacterized protein n=1 Tax=Chrysophaeum taylorii TaxID=2483200 RepID=A0AAD7UAU9_9STRA|nr:hypothetical protein CTAYLR_001996 [Chrysophaeum taylorii]